jgi:hypothetical protein
MVSDAPLLPPPPRSRITARPRALQIREDTNAIARRRIAYGLVWLLAVTIGVSAIMLFVMLYCQIPEAAHFVLDWMGIALGPVGALTGSAVTFYMERSGSGRMPGSRSASIDLPASAGATVQCDSPNAPHV